jgi:hypothetical protein
LIFKKGEKVDLESKRILMKMLKKIKVNQTRDIKSYYQFLRSGDDLPDKTTCCLGTVTPVNVGGYLGKLAGVWIAHSGVVADEVLEFT